MRSPHRLADITERAEWLWVFNGENGRFAGGIFTSRAKAEAWITENALSGVLTRYPVDVGVHEWAISQGLFTPTKPHESEPDFVAGFTMASQEHYHYEAGRIES